MRHTFPCNDPDCGYCEARAEERAEDTRLDDDQAGQDQYERHLDRMGGDL